MASIKKKSSGGGGGANWMDTYGDMVTLLLCFFVLLYSMSTIDTQKWEWIVQQFNKNYSPEEVVPPGPAVSGSSSGGDAQPTTSEVETAMDELYSFLVQYAQSNPDASVSVSRGDGYVFISFDDTVFFDGNSAEIRPEGKTILDSIIPALEKAGPFIDELRVLGHTAQQYSDRPNRIPNDRRLASNRATEVTIYIQERIPSEVLDPGRLIAEGYGQWRPVSPNDNNDTRAKNRRVELVVTGKNLDGLMSDKFEQYFTMYESTTGQTAGGSD